MAVERQFRSQAQFARAVGVSQGNLCRWTKREDWPAAVPRVAPWTNAHAAAVRAFAATLQDNRDESRAKGRKAPESTGTQPAGEYDIGEDDSPESLLKLIRTPEKRIKLAAVIERAAKVRVEREALLGGYVIKEEVERGRVARIQAVVNELQNARLLALRMEGKSVREMEEILEDWARGVCGKFERGE